LVGNFNHEGHEVHEENFIVFVMSTEVETSLTVSELAARDQNATLGRKYLKIPRRRLG